MTQDLYGKESAAAHTSAGNNAGMYAGAPMTQPLGGMGQPLTISQYPLVLKFGAQQDVATYPFAPWMIVPGIVFYVMALIIGLAMGTALFDEIGASVLIPPFAFLFIGTVVLALLPRKQEVLFDKTARSIRVTVWTLPTMKCPAIRDVPFADVGQVKPMIFYGKHGRAPLSARLILEERSGIPIDLGSVPLYVSDEHCASWNRYLVDLAAGTSPSH